MPRDSSILPSPQEVLKRQIDQLSSEQIKQIADALQIPYSNEETLPTQIICILHKISKAHTSELINPNLLLSGSDVPSLQNVIAAFNSAKTLKYLQQLRLDDEFSFCYCYLYSQVLTPTTPHYIRCYHCQKLYHGACLSVKEDFACPKCTITLNDPLHKVSSVIFSIPVPRDRGFEIDLSLREESRQLLMNPNARLELRSILVDGLHHEQTWPDHFEVTIDGAQVLKDIPIDAILAAKKRKDATLVLPHEDFIGNKSKIVKMNILPIPSEWMSTRKCTTKGFYYMALVVTEKKTVQELISELQVEANQDRSVPTSMIKKLMAESDEISLTKMQLQLTCSIDKLRLKTPVRGNFCRHIECFSAENFFASMEKAGNQRIWRCPLCRKKAYKLVLDRFVQSLVSNYPDSTEITLSDKILNHPPQYATDKKIISIIDELRELRKALGLVEILEKMSKWNAVCEEEPNPKEAVYRIRGFVEEVSKLVDTGKENISLIDENEGLNTPYKRKRLEDDQYERIEINTSQRRATRTIGQSSSGKHNLIHAVLFSQLNSIEVKMLSFSEAFLPSPQYRKSPLRELTENIIE
eukprot:TRINITY_DN9744_c0_g1_i7.p1 TRINITY_DN9744_c0_g1~~TRINITY_DN9744_c0_g1_i7.p1  ORF type:complete len:581 (+),score=62.69 TRINITY_DN9744_c0_g1_i7:127-1869(+)